MVIKVKNNGEWVKIPYLSSDNNPIIPEAPLDGKQYARQNGEWTVVNIPEVDFTEINQKISQNTAAIAANTTAIQSKVDKVDGFGLSSNDYTSQEKTKLAGIAASANNYSLPAATSSVLGGVKTSTGITNSSGTISVTYELNDWVFDTFGFSYFGYKALWSSTQQDATTAWQLDISSGAYNTTAKRTLNTALPVIRLG